MRAGRRQQSRFPLHQSSATATRPEPSQTAPQRGPRCKAYLQALSQAQISHLTAKHPHERACGPTWAKLAPKQIAKPALVTAHERRGLRPRSRAQSHPLVLGHLAKPNWDEKSETPPQGAPPPRRCASRSTQKRTPCHNQGAARPDLWHAPERSTITRHAAKCAALSQILIAQNQTLAQNMTKPWN